MIPYRLRDDYDPLGDDELTLARRDAAREWPPSAPAGPLCARCSEQWRQFIFGERQQLPERCEHQPYGSRPRGAVGLHDISLRRGN
ncbi:MAG: hypothetical protein ABSB73_12605 [Solirubrobacteraceae bacterium]|jgi:hypothetical protein